MPVERLPQNPSLEHLRKQARAVQRDARVGAPAALSLVREHHPRGAALLASEVARPAFALADAQLVVARQYGFPSWPRLKRHLEIVSQYSRMPQRHAQREAVETGAPAGSSEGAESLVEVPPGASLVEVTPGTSVVEVTPGASLAGGRDGAADTVLADRFLSLACLTYDGDHPHYRQQAQAMLANHPGLSVANVFTMAACGEASALRALLAQTPALAHRQGGPFNWEPLLYLAYGRVEPVGPDGSAVEAARVLLATGADPNAGYLWHGLPSPFTALTGVLGEGEGGANQPPHPDAFTLARLLLEAGADPNDSQALYNRQFRPGTAHLELLLEHGLGRGDGGVWHARLGPSHPTPAELLEDQLLWAARTGMTDRVRLLLTAGAQPDGPGTAHPIFGGQTALTLAQRLGHQEIAALLLAAGAQPCALDPLDEFLGACLGGDRPAVERTLAREPMLLPRALREAPDLIRRAVEHGRGEVIPLLLDLGFDVNVVHPETALHQAAWSGDLPLVQMLLDLGADPTLPDLRFNATPLGWARHNQQDAVAAYLEALA